MKLLISFTLFLTSVNLLAQWSDNFADGNFTTGPSWSGDADNYTVNTAQQLQLNAPAKDGSAYLETSSSVAMEALWSFWVGMDFNPSASNYAKVYLMSDVDDLSGSLNGYFLKIGGTNDDVCLFRQNGVTETLVVDGRDKVFNTTTVNARVKVTRDKLGTWQLYCDTTGGSNFRLSGQGTDKTIAGSAYLGVQCVFTSTRCNKFYFDDFVVTSNGQTDGNKPGVSGLAVMDNHRLQIIFSEAVDYASATNTGNYKLADNSISTIAVAVGTKYGYELSFAGAFRCESDNQLTISGVKDLSGLLMSDTTLPFRYCTPQMYDVVFNEIMADPTPVNGLPEAEYLELYNRSQKTLDLLGWKLSVGSSVFTFPETTLPAGGYLLVVSKGNESLFTSPALGLFTSSTTLANTGQYLKLLDDKGNMVSWVDYGDDWYGDDLKAQGGWSLEQMDPWNPCAGKLNWKASVAGPGGTPGGRNSVFAPNLDGSLPDLWCVHVPADTVVNIYFSEPVDSSIATSISTYKITPDLGHPQRVSMLGSDYSSVQLVFSHAMKSGVFYSLTVSQKLTDCAGNQPLDDLTTKLGLPFNASYNDIIINEVLFNAYAGGADYVELYNRSDKILDAGKLYLATQTDGKLSGTTRLSESGFLILPSTYLLVTASQEKVKLFYQTGAEKYFDELSALPSLNDNASTVVLLNDTFATVDEFSYTDNMHVPTLKITEGVSLERVSPDKLANFPGNWHSAAQTAGFGTPGLRNSQYLADSAASDAIQLVEKLFSPDNDGYHDVLQVQYKFGAPGCRAQASVYDASGRLVRRIFNNELLGVEGSFVWDGTNDAGKLCNVGLYVLFVRTVFDNGTVREYKKACALAIKR